jgi:hypothetical protein
VNFEKSKFDAHLYKFDKNLNLNVSNGRDLKNFFSPDFLEFTVDFYIFFLDFFKFLIILNFE